MKGFSITYSSDELFFIKSKSKLPRKKLHELFCDEFKRNDVSQSTLSALCLRKRWITGRTGQYKPGNIPHPNCHLNRDYFGVGFKKGHRPHNWMPVGSKRLSKDGYVEIKISEPKIWKSLHVILWEKEYGVVPGGFCVSFKNGDKTKVKLENLELITRNSNLQINKLAYSKQPKILKPIVRTLGKLIAVTQLVNSKC
jgi:hypothetical protein